jgi:hypothetical protein
MILNFLFIFFFFSFDFFQAGKSQKIYSELVMNRELHVDFAQLPCNVIQFDSKLCEWPQTVNRFWKFN